MSQPEALLDLEDLAFDNEMLGRDAAHSNGASLDSGYPNEL